MNKLAISTAAVLLLISSARAEMPIFQTNGNVLYEACSDESSKPFCWPYINGVSDMLLQAEWETGNWAYCRPVGSTGEQLADVVMQYLKENPKQRHLVAAALVRAALFEAFPCKSTRKGGQ